MIFQSFKHFHVKAVNNATYIGCSDFNKLEFLVVINRIRQYTFKKHSLLSSFQQCGIVPYNPQVVINKVQEYLPSENPVRPVTPLNGFIEAPMTL
jgi:hypothetical protein